MTDKNQHLVLTTKLHLPHQPFNFSRDLKVSSSPKQRAQFPHFDPLYLKPILFEEALLFAQQWVESFSRRGQSVDALIGIEGRGLVLASALAHKCQLPLILARRSKKLPHLTLKTDTLLGEMEIHADSFQENGNYLVVDGTPNVEHHLQGVFNLIEKTRSNCLGVLCFQRDPDFQSGDIPMLELFKLTQSRGLEVELLLDKSVMTKMSELNKSEAEGDIESEKRLNKSAPSQSHFLISLESWLKTIKETIRTVPNFPHAPIMFRDITPLIMRPDVYEMIIEILVDHYRGRGITCIMGIESRGFLFAVPLALRLGLPFVPISKKGKSLSPTVQRSYTIEYGQDEVELTEGSVGEYDKVVIVDDLLATGGTAQCAASLVRQMGAQVYEITCIVELTELKGREQLSDPLFTLIEFTGH
jgi:adenine phosphoribosyltransferase